MCYGPLALGVSSVLFEGIPTHPDAGRAWAVVEKYKVNVLYTGEFAAGVGSTMAAVSFTLFPRPLQPRPPSAR